MNFPPVFNSGPLKNLRLCQNSSGVVLDTFLAISDPDVGQTLTIGINRPPTHGTLHGFPGTGKTNGSVFSPTGFDYTPTVGYAGKDQFIIQVTDGTDFAYITFNVTIDSLPFVAPITGIATICGSGSSTLSSLTGGGKWSTSNPFSTSVDSVSGVVTSVAAGLSLITYSVVSATGCSGSASTNFIVSGLPTINATSGNASLCVGATTTFRNTTPNGVWSSADTNIAKVNNGAVVSGITSGATTIVYTVTNAYGCTGTAVKSIIVNPAPIVDTLKASADNVCVGNTIALSTTTKGGVWSSSDVTIASVQPNGTQPSAVVTGVAVGTASLFYTVTGNNGCKAVASKTISVGNLAPLVDSIKGNALLCTQTSTALTNNTANGVWSSSNPTVATVNPNGIVNGLTAGTANIIYTVTNGCSSSVTALITVQATSPVAAIVGEKLLCIGSETKFTNATAGGVWGNLNGSVLKIDSTGQVTGFAKGTDSIYYTATNLDGCKPTVYFLVSVDSALKVAPITGKSSVCSGDSLLLSTTTVGGAWSSSNTSLATVDAFGKIASLKAGTVIIKYSLGSGSCAGTGSKVIVINPSVSIAPNNKDTVFICQSDSVQLTNSTAGGVWSIQNTTVAYINQNGWLVGYLDNLKTTTVSYTVSNSYGCQSAAATVVISNPKPAPFLVRGNYATCVGTNSVFNATTGGGVWSISDSSKASFTDYPGYIVVTTLAPGTVNVSYTKSNGYCERKVGMDLVINATLVPSPIQGPATACLGSQNTYFDSIAKGVWTVANGTGTASILPNTGIFTPTKQGTVTITYSVNDGGCVGSMSKTITIYTNPVVGNTSGPTDVCIGDSIKLTNPTPNGVWSSANINQAIVNPTTGYVVGLQATGNPNIQYTVTNAGGCKTSVNYYVNVSMGIMITNKIESKNVCKGTSIVLSNSYPGGKWFSKNNNIAVADSLSGKVTGADIGTVYVQYILKTTYVCPSVANFIVTVKPIPAILSTLPANDLCAGNSLQLVNNTIIPAGGSARWSSNAPSIAAIDSLSGLMTGVSAGSATLVYKVTDEQGFCENSTSSSININAIPSLTAIVGLPDKMCLGNSALLSNSLSGGNWALDDSSKATITAVGNLATIDTGDVIVGYALTNNGCSAKVFGSTTIVGAPVAPTISGLNSVGKGATVQLAGTPSNGIWKSSDPSVATVDNTGKVIGIKAGQTIISYTIANGNGCTSTATSVFFVNAPLSIGIVDLAAQKQENSIVVFWKTIGGEDNTFFDVERSTDKLKFEPIATLSPTATHGYLSTDNRLPETEAVYYRIVAREKDGKKIYSSVVTVNLLDPTASLQVYPNPVKDVLNVEGKEIKSLTIYDAEGRRVIVKAGFSGKATVNVSGLAKGTYLVQAITKDESKIEKRFIK